LLDNAGVQKRMTDRNAIAQLVAGHGRWWHEIEVAPGIITPGDDSNRMKLPILDQLGLPATLSGQRVLDIGCSDGFFSFEMEKRGADVVAIDFVPETYSGFSTARTILGSGVEYRMDNVYNLNPAAYGSFDVVLFLGVLYHLRKPLAALDAIRSVMKNGAQLFIGTMLIDEYVLMPDNSVTSLDQLNPLLRSIPLWQSFPADSLNGDFTNCFAPNMRSTSRSKRRSFALTRSPSFPWEVTFEPLPWRTRDQRNTSASMRGSNRHRSIPPFHTFSMKKDRNMPSQGPTAAGTSARSRVGNGGHSNGRRMKRSSNALSG
jgi:tRNA (mo5U34)-methyltransferase